jgi:23S rRNA (adenine1618-N6)-methyltransferase
MKTYKLLDQLGVEEYRIIVMGQGNKVSRILAWTFLNTDEQSKWAQSRW